MSVVIPVLTARMGSRDYYITKMTAFELSSSVGIASELDDFGGLTLEDLYQRDLNKKRVEQEIAPYLANAKDRFFGSIIVWILGDEVVSFEPAGDLVSVRAAYMGAARSLGFLTIDNKEQRSGLVALDGQHRLAALREVVQGNVQGEHRDAACADEIAVIFVSDTDVRSARDLFTVLNRSARKVSKNDVLIMSEVDGAAIVARRITSSNLLAPFGLLDRPLVKWESNTINKKDRQFTTLNAIYEVVKEAASLNQIDLISGEDSGTPPSQSELDRAFDVAHAWISSLFRQSEEFASIRNDPNVTLEAREKESPYSLLLRPVGLQSFFGAVSNLLNPEICGLDSHDEAIRRLLLVDWSQSSQTWSGILVNANGRLTNKRSDIALAANLAAWMAAGESISVEYRQALRDRLRQQLDRGDFELPEPVVAG